MSKIKFDNGFLEIRNKTDERAELHFYGNILAKDSWWKDEGDQCPATVKQCLDDVKNVKNLDIYINSGGGSVFGGMAIYNMLKRNTANKTVYVDGLAASIASVIAFAGDKVIIPKNAFLMIHKASACACGNADNFRKIANTLETVEEGILNVYEANLKDGVSIETIKEMMNEETWFTGEQAAEYFNVEVSDEIDAVASLNGLDIENYSNIPKTLKNENKEQLFSNEQINNIVARVREAMSGEDAPSKTKDVNNFTEIRRKLIEID